MHGNGTETYLDFAFAAGIAARILSPLPISPLVREPLLVLRVDYTSGRGDQTCGSRGGTVWRRRIG